MDIVDHPHCNHSSYQNYERITVSFWQKENQIWRRGLTTPSNVSHRVVVHDDHTTTKRGWQLPTKSRVVKPCVWCRRIITTPPRYYIIRHAVLRTATTKFDLTDHHARQERFWTDPGRSSRGLVPIDAAHIYLEEHFWDEIVWNNRSCGDCCLSIDVVVVLSVCCQPLCFSERVLKSCTSFCHESRKSRSVRGIS